MFNCLIEKFLFGFYRYSMSDIEGGYSCGGDDWFVFVGRFFSVGFGYY